MLRLQPKIRLLAELLDDVWLMAEVAEVRGRGFMVGIDLGEHDAGLRMGHRVTLEARERGVIVRPLGDTIVLMPPLAISKDDAAPAGRDHGGVDLRPPDASAVRAGETRRRLSLAA